MGQNGTKPASALWSLNFSAPRGADAMIETDPLSTVLLANDAAQTILQAGPPSDLPAQVPDFVGDILETVRNSAGDGGLGETISELAPGGSEAADGANKGVEAGAGTEDTSS